MKFSVPLLFFLQISSIIAAEEDESGNGGNTITAYGCDITSNAHDGFDATIFQYNANDLNLIRDPTFMSIGYLGRTVLNRMSGVTTPGFNIWNPTSSVATVYGVGNVNYYNMVLELKGYFKADISGDYKLTLSNIDDSSMLFFGKETAFQCCDTGSIPLNDAPNDYSLFTIKPTGQQNSEVISASQYMEAGKYYPVRIVFVNALERALFNFKLTLPDGTVLDDFKNYIYQFNELDENSCQETTVTKSIDWTTYTTHWTGTFETTRTITPTGAEGTVVVETPESYVTTTQPWTGTYETTYTVPPSGTEPGTVVVETPEPSDCVEFCCQSSEQVEFTKRELCQCDTICCPGDLSCESYVTTTQPWTGTYETTYTVPPSGTEPGTVVVETPEPSDCVEFCCQSSEQVEFTKRELCQCDTICCPGDLSCESYVTTTQPWTGTYETTYTVPPSGTEPGTVVVETPESYVTTTQPWTGTYETTYTVPPSGTEPGTVVVETPESYVTTTQPWTGTYETTYTVPPSGTEPGTVVVETPEPSDCVEFCCQSSEQVEFTKRELCQCDTICCPGDLSCESYVTTTQPWTGTYETTYTVPPSGTEPGTVVVETPESYVTTTQPWTGTYETTYTVPPSGTEPGTVVVETPESYVTTTQPWTGTYETTYTVPPSGTEPGTVVVETPESYVTTTQPWTGTYETTYTVPPSGTEPGTVVVETPEPSDCVEFCCQSSEQVEFTKRELCQCDTICCPGDLSCESYVTTTQPWTGTYETTYTVPPSGTEPGTVVVETPEPSDCVEFCCQSSEQVEFTKRELCQCDTICCPGDLSCESYVTTTQPWTGTYETTYTVPPSGTEPGTVVVETPESYVTTTQPWTGTYETTYTVPPSGTEPGTVVVETPESYVTTTQPWTGTYETTYTVPPSGTEPGTVVVETPESYVTTTQPWTGTYETTYTVPPSGTEPGTVVVETPESYVTTTQPWTGTYETTYTVPPSGTEPGTVVVETPESYVTTTQPWTGTYETTYTVPPSGTEPGTVVVETPESYVTTTQPWTGTYETTYTVPPSGTEPGTVVVETPESYVTTTQPWTGTYETTYTVPPSGTEPGTVVVETPEPSDCVEFCCQSSEQVEFTKRELCQCDTICCPGDLSCESYVTTTQPWTGTYETTYTVPPSGTEPGTVVVETPESYVTTTQPWTGTYETTYTVPPSGTEPGTVVVETPESYVTTTQPWTGTYETTYTVPPSGTEPGTVVVETPESYVTTTQPWTGTYETTYTVPPSGTEPGTVVVETPESYVTTTQPWTGTYETTYTVPPSGTEPGTLIIQTPTGYFNTSSVVLTRTKTNFQTTTKLVPCPVCTVTEFATITPENPYEYVTVIISQPQTASKVGTTPSKIDSTYVATETSGSSNIPPANIHSYSTIASSKISTVDNTAHMTVTTTATDSPATSHSYSTIVNSEINTEVKTEHVTARTTDSPHSFQSTTFTSSPSGHSSDSTTHLVEGSQTRASSLAYHSSLSTVYQVSNYNAGSQSIIPVHPLLSVIGALIGMLLL